MVKVEIDVPEQLHDFLRALTQFADLNVAKYVSDMAVSNIMSDLNTFNAVPFLSEDMIKAKYGLRDIKDYFTAESRQRVDHVKQIAERLERKARTRGISVEELVAEIVDDYVPDDFLRGEV